jgi:hypothetical protein
VASRPRARFNMACHVVVCWGTRQDQIAVAALNATGGPPPLASHTVRAEVNQRQSDLSRRQRPHRALRPAPASSVAVRCERDRIGDRYLAGRAWWSPSLYLLRFATIPPSPHLLVPPADAKIRGCRLGWVSAEDSGQTLVCHVWLWLEQVFCILARSIASFTIVTSARRLPICGQEIPLKKSLTT